VLFGITVNQLDALNQTLGHTACDRLLVQIARQLRELTGNQAILARITGGQFAVLLDAKAATGAEALSKKLKEMFATLTASEGDRSVKPDVTLQQLRLDAQHKDRQAIMDRVFKMDTQPAPVAAPAAVAVPAARVAVTPPPATVPVAAIPALSLQPTTRRAGADWREALQNALAHDQMQLLFQPIINLHGEPRCFYEAQLMLRTLDGKVITPSEYMPSAEAARIGDKIDRSLMMNVIDLLSKYHLEGRPGIVFVSLSSMAVQDNALLTAVQMHMKATGLDAASLILQLDEAVLAQHPDASRSFIQKAREMGMGIAMDRFTGQVLSVEALTSLNVDYFGVNCGTGGLDGEPLTTAIGIVNELERMVLAKGIEDADIFSMLFARGVHYVQGDYLQPASPGLDYSFETEQTLASDEPHAPNWRAAG
jgi:EAL domain-containing protein (putative c-di-GMP-specific phosphodiesterase class I)